MNKMMDDKFNEFWDQNGHLFEDVDISDASMFFSLAIQVNNKPKQEALEALERVDDRTVSLRTISLSDKEFDHNDEDIELIRNYIEGKE